MGGECGFTNTGFLWIEPASGADRLRANVADHRDLGIETSVVDAPEMRRIAPGLAVDDDEVAAYEPGSGYADPSGTASGFMRAARDRGARLFQGAGVTAINVDGGFTASL